MRTDLRNAATARDVRKAAPRIPRAVLVAALIGLAPAAMADPAPGHVLLIDASRHPGAPVLAACDAALGKVRDRLEGAGQQVTLLVAPSSADIRHALLRASTESGGARAIIYCGYAASRGDDIFVLGSDVGSDDELGFDAISVRSFSRVLAAPTGAILLDLHPAEASTASALGKAASAWTATPDLPGRKRAELASGGTAPLSERVAAAPTTADLFDAAAPQAPPPAPAAAAIADQVSKAPAAPPGAPRPIAPPAPTAAPEDAAQPEATKSLPAPTPASTAKPASSSAAPATPPAATAAPAAETTKAANAPAQPRRPPHARPAPRPDAATRRIQVALLARGLFSGRVSGISDNATHAGIRHFQAMIGHPQTGTLTPAEAKLLTNG